MGFILQGPWNFAQNLTIHLVIVKLSQSGGSAPKCRSIWPLLSSYKNMFLDEWNPVTMDLLNENLSPPSLRFIVTKKKCCLCQQCLASLGEDWFHFPLMYFKCSIFPLTVSCKRSQHTSSLYVHLLDAVRSRRPDRQLPGRRFSWKLTLSWGPLGEGKFTCYSKCSSVHIETFTVTDCRLHLQWLWMSAMAYHSRGYYKFDNISVHCRKIANTNTS